MNGTNRRGGRATRVARVAMWEAAVLGLTLAVPAAIPAVAAAQQTKAKPPAAAPAPAPQPAQPPIQIFGAGPLVQPVVRGANGQWRPAPELLPPAPPVVIIAPTPTYGVNPVVGQVTSGFGFPVAGGYGYSTVTQPYVISAPSVYGPVGFIQQPIISEVSVVGGTGGGVASGFTAESSTPFNRGFASGFSNVGIGPGGIIGTNSAFQQGINVGANGFFNPGGGKGSFLQFGVGQAAGGLAGPRGGGVPGAGNLAGNLGFGGGGRNRIGFNIGAGQAAAINTGVIAPVGGFGGLGGFGVGSGAFIAPGGVVVFPGGGGGFGGGGFSGFSGVNPIVMDAGGGAGIDIGGAMGANIAGIWGAPADRTVAANVASILNLSSDPMRIVTGAPAGGFVPLFQEYEAPIVLPDALPAGGRAPQPIIGAAEAAVAAAGNAGGAGKVGGGKMRNLADGPAIPAGAVDAAVRERNAAAAAKAGVGAAGNVGGDFRRFARAPEMGHWVGEMMKSAAATEYLKDAPRGRRDQMHGRMLDLLRETLSDGRPLTFPDGSALQLRKPDLLALVGPDGKSATGWLKGQEMPESFSGVVAHLLRAADR